VKAKFTGRVEACASSSAKISSAIRRDLLIVNMARAVVVWLEDETHKGLSVSGAVVRLI
jgi:hypothetical protein